MALIKSVWNALRGIVLLLVLSVLFTLVVAVSCLARLVFGSGAPGYAGRVHPP